MSNTKATPGPWKYAGQDYAQGTHITVYCEQGTNVASVTKSPWTGNKGPSAAKYLEVAEANANLIAAAPDLLEALQAFAAVDAFDGWHTKYRDAIAKAEAAIAKATAQ